MMHTKPKRIEKIGEMIAILWSDDSESYFDPLFLRENSPSAENQGEVDILGQRHGGREDPLDPAITVLRWERIGNYAIRFVFSDGHSTGLYSWDYLKKLDSRKHG